MSMKKVSLMALGLALALGSATPGLAKKKEEPKPAGANYSKELIPLAKAAQDAMAANDLDTALAKAQAAEPLIKTDDDKLIVGNFYVQIGQKKNDNALLGKGIDMMLSSGKVEPANQAKLYVAQGQLAFQAKDFRKSAEAMSQALKAGGDMNDIVPILAESQRSTGDLVGAIQSISDAADKAAAAGQPVPNEWFARGFTIGYEAKSTTPNVAQVRAAANALDKKWLAAQPTGSVWHDTMLLYQDANPNDKDLQIDIERLLFAANGLKGTNEYLGYADDVYVRLPGEAKAVLAAGIAKGVVNPAANRNVGEINQIVTGKVAADKASLPASEKSAKTGANGRLALATADSYASYGDYAKAIELYKVALQKGGIDANVVNTRLGVAQFKSGDKAGAKQTFGTLTGARKDLGDFWTILIDHPPTGAPA